MWRPADPRDDAAIERMCAALYEEDPGPDPLSPDNIGRTLRTLRESPARGQVLVLELEGRTSGYSILISYWSNELGGDVCIIDEIFVAPEHRGRGYATALIENLAARTLPVAANAVALALETTPDNAAARRLYERLGFRGRNLGMRRLLHG